MKLQTIFLGVLSHALAVQCLAVGERSAIPNDYYPEHDLAARAATSPASQLGSMAFELIFTPYLEQGINMFAKLFGFDAGLGYATLSQESLDAIRGIINQALADSWKNRDFNDAEAFADHVLGYTRGSILNVASLISAQEVTDQHTRRALDLMAQLDDYKLQSSIVYQSVLGIYVFMQRNLVTITHLLDEAYLAENPKHKREAGIKLNAMVTFLDKATPYLQGLQTDFRNYGNSLYRIVFTSGTIWAAGFPHSETCKHQKWERIQVQKRSSQSAKWNDIRNKKFQWVMCLSRPSSKINAETDYANNLLASERSKWFNDHKADMLTAEFPNTLLRLNAIKTWSVAQVVNSTDPDLNSPQRIADIVGKIRTNGGLEEVIITA